MDGSEVWFLGVLVLTLFIYLRLESWSVHWSMQLAGWCTILGVGCLCLHAELVKRQPATQQLTNYYVSIAAGVIGGLIVGSILPAFINLRLEVDFTIMATVGYLWHASRKRSEGQMSFASLYRHGHRADVAGLFGVVLTYRVLKELSGETHVYRNAYV